MNTTKSTALSLCAMNTSTKRALRYVDLEQLLRDVDMVRGCIAAFAGRPVAARVCEAAETLESQARLADIIARVREAAVVR